MFPESGRKPTRSHKGFSVIELLIVVTITVVLTAIALPQMLSQRRLMRSSVIAREIMTQLRHTRQLAMSQRRAFTFQYDDATKEIKIIGPIPAGAPALLPAAGYPNNLGSSVISTISLARGGVPTSEISYGIPTTMTGLPAGAPTIPTGPLDDLVPRTNLPGDNKLNITFQPDGSVIDATGPLDRSIFIFNNRAAQGTASAISVLGTSGRVKMWRYSLRANKYEE